MPTSLQTLLIHSAPDFWEHTWLESLAPGVTLDYVTDATALDEGRPTVVIVSMMHDQYREEVTNVLERFRSAGRPAGLIHLGDEYYECDLSFYGRAAFVARNYWKPACPPALDGAVRFLPLGYKAQFTDFLRPRPRDDRKYRWSFAGEVKGRRVEMLAAMQAVPGGSVHRTYRWNDPNALTTQQYAELMCDSVFVPCPRGNNSVDCFRIYESLEAGAIPLVEDDGRWARALDSLRVPAALRNYRPPRGSAIYRSRMGAPYWAGLFGPDFPLPRISRWTDAGQVMDAFDNPLAREKIAAWWEGVKTRTRSDFNALLVGFANAAKPVD